MISDTISFDSAGEPSMEMTLDRNTLDQDTMDKSMSDDESDDQRMESQDTHDVEVGHGNHGDISGDLTEGTTLEVNDGQLDTEDGEREMPWSAAALAIGSLCCWCKPTRASGPKDICMRSAGWTVFNKGEFFSGLTVAVAHVPEVIAYALLAGIPPTWALTTGWIMCIVTSVLGGGAHIISGTTASIAVALLSLVQEKGLGYVPYAVMFASFFQIAFGVLQMGEFIRFIPYSVMVGFLNAMAIITVIFQLRFFKDFSTLPEGDSRTYEVEVHNNAFSVLYQGSWIDMRIASVMLIEAGITFLITLILGRFCKWIPSSFVAMVVVTSMEWAIARTTGFPGLLVGDLAEISTPNYPFPYFLTDEATWPPINYDTFKAVWPTGIAIFLVAQVESLLVHRHVSDEAKIGEEVGASRMAFSQGIAQFLSSFLGGMGGTAMLGDSEVLIKSGGASNLATFWCGLLLMTINFVAIPAVNIVPMGFIIGLMCWAAFNMIRWRAFLTILASFFPQGMRDIMYLDSKVNRMDTVIMLVMLVMTFFLDVAMGAIVSISIGALSYAWEWSHRLELERDYGEELSPDMVTYKLKGTIFFATANKLVHKLTTEEIEEDPDEVVILMSEAEVFDWSGMLALKRLHDKIQSCGKSVAISTLTASSKAVMEKSSAMWEGVVFFEVEENYEDESQIFTKKSGLDDTLEEGVSTSMSGEIA